MKNLAMTMAAWGLVLLVGVTASAQTNDQGESSKNQQGDAQQRQDANQTQDQAASQPEGQTETIRGEIAGVSVIGETMVDFNTGRGVEAEFTYLTILGSPTRAGRRGGERGQAEAGRDDSRRDDQDHQASRPESEAQGSNRDQADQDRGNQDRSGERSANRRRNVYQIAIAPDTRVRSRNARGGQGSREGQGGQARSDRNQTQSGFEELEIGDRVQVEFTRISSQDQSGAGGGGQGDNASQSRYGRSRIIRGMAKTITILSIPDRDGDRDRPEGRNGGGSTPEGQQSGSSSQD